MPEITIRGYEITTYTAQIYAESVTASETQSFVSGENTIEIAGGDAIIADPANVIAVGVSEASATKTLRTIKNAEIEVTGAGIMKGRGVFCATTLSGKLIVGNSPGLQTFTDTLTLNADSETVFSIFTLETGAMATTTTCGWGSGVNSTIDMRGNNLVWNEGAPSRFLQLCLLSA